MIGYPYYSRVDAAKAAVVAAEIDIKEGVVVRLAYGGPMAPWSGDTADKMRALGIKTLATGLCMVSGHNDLYTEVYELVTERQRVTWLDGSPCKDEVFSCARVQDSDTYNNWLNKFKLYDETH